MSLLAEVMNTLRFTEEQNKLILARNHSNETLAKMFKTGVRQIQRQRKFLRSMKDE